MKLYFLFFNLFLLSQNSIAQNQWKFYIEPKLTLSSQVKDKASLEIDTGTGFRYGKGVVNNFDTYHSVSRNIALEFRTGWEITKSLRLFSGLRYFYVNERGRLFCNGCETFYPNSNMKLHLLEVPLGARFLFLKNKKVRPFIEAEVFGSYALTFGIMKHFLFSDEIIGFWGHREAIGAAYSTSPKSSLYISLGTSSTISRKNYPKHNFRDINLSISWAKLFQ